jgi:anaerobic magnesium-protoporphyrin IX monomethyl ester cyclase
MKILLTYISGQADRQDPFVTMLPTGLCYLHSTLIQAGFDSTLVNLSGCSDQQIIKQLATLKPSIICISQWTHNRHASLDLARLVRQALPECLVLMGGGHATFQYREMLGKDSPVDIVVIGEGEATLRELVECRQAGKSIEHVSGIACRNKTGVVVTPSRQLLADLDSIPFSSLYLDRSIGVDIELQAEFIVTSRGCPSACRFCSSPVFWSRRVRFRSPENIVDEIMFIRQRFGLIYFSFRDDTFTADRSRTIDFCRLLIERKAGIIWNCQSRVTALDQELLVWMKRAGCECVQLGVESGSPETLALLGKKITPAQVEIAASQIRQVGINLSVYLISDIPGEQEHDIAATLSLMRRINPDDGYVSPLAYYPGTALFEEAVEGSRVSSGIFVANRKEAVYAADRPGQQSQRYLKALSGKKPDLKRFERQKSLLGYCYTTNVIAGESYLQHGNISAAENEFREIVSREPDNPWGWYLLGELLAESGNRGEALDCYMRLLEIVPKHREAQEAVRKIKKRGR